MPDGTPDAPQSDPAETAPSPTSPPSDAQPPEKGDDADELSRLKVEVERWKAMSRQNEEQSSKTAKELDKLRRQSMTDQEKAVLDAKASGRAEAMAEVGGKLVDAEIRTLAAGRLTADQLSVLLQAVNRSVFLLPDGSVDVKSVATYVDGVFPPPPEPAPTTPGFPDLGQGARGPIPALNGDPLLAHIKSKLGIA